MLSRRSFMANAAAPAILTAAPSRQRPNIVWISCEDTGPQVGCFGDPNSITPNIDRLASEGVRYTSAYTVAGVCAPSRSGIITGMYPTTLGSQYMRCRIQLPEFVKCFPAYLREAGYYCTNNVKTDYNFEPPEDSWDEISREAHWKKRPADKPFFSVFNIETTHESRVRMRGAAFEKETARLKPTERRDPRALKLPPYYPDTEPSRRDWANYYELITAMDYQVGDRLREIEQAGLLENTIIFFWGDHGVGLPRAKRWLYESSTHVPLVVRIPAKFRAGWQGRPGWADSQLVSFIDLAPTVLNLAGVPIPEHMQGRAFLGRNLRPERTYVHAARDRMDERYDSVRMVRGRRYRYLRNYMPHKPYAQYTNYMEQGFIMKELRRLAKEGKLPEAARLFMSDTKPIEELYDVQRDPHELSNLAEVPDYARILEDMRAAHERWAVETRDVGLIPEPLVAEREQKHGTRYASLRRGDGLDLITRLRAVVNAVNRGEKVDGALKDSDPAVRYWAVVGSSNVKALTEDPDAVVRIAAAQKTGEASIIARELDNTNEWTRLHAAIALDEMGVAEALRPALEDKNEYVRRVAEHAVNKA